ncbi:cellulose biosynthesis cyclic di-GMP-binding regulatory protein BcsB [Oceaniglobus indicus]|uniref:cellulose biosynthesis cyclic di-GMP-binding regulatory protein BcsB n=1 Tax=Oceaniglobus indicus TaxID=2047749 RepID=UPI0013043EC7|nr:cellulose biosynthesis cyclic di-GMP-binding regulatory protein BcsB [Oceaniglobus indicus]
MSVFFLRCPLLIATTLIGAVVWAPVAAQSPADVPTIDLAPVLDLAIEQDDGPSPAPAPVPDVAPTTLDVVPDDALTLPAFNRSGDAPAVTTDQPALLPLAPARPSLDSIVRLTGEVQHADFTIDLPDYALPRDLAISYRVAINVLPQESHLTVRVNGTDLPQIQPDAFEGFETVLLPANLLVPGRNDIRITVQHGHRIFCGPEATFAVWTEIDTDASGVRMAAADLPPDPLGLRLALGAQMAQSGNLPVRLANPEDAGILVALTPRLSGLRPGAPVEMDLQPFHSVAEGPSQVARITVLSGATPAASVRRGADGALVLLLTVGYDGTYPDIAPFLPTPEPVANLATLVPGTPMTLADLGFERTDAFNRYTEQPVEFLLPRDWLILTAKKARLSLNYAFADDLPEGALMLVKVNGETVRLLPLDVSGGRTLPTLDIDFPARLMRPGANALTFVTIVPGDPPDLPCLAGTGPLVSIGPGSALRVPESPKMRQIDLSDPLATLRFDQIQPVSGEMEDLPAGRLLERLASAFRPIDGTTRAEAASLTVTNVRTLEGLDLTDLGIGRRDLIRLLPETVAPLEPSGETADAETPPVAQTRGTIQKAKDGIQAAAAWFARLAVPGDGPLETWLAGRSAQAVLFIPDAEAPESVWLMADPDVDARRLAAVLAQARLSPEGPRGRLAILDPEGRWENWQPASRPPNLDEPLTIANFHRVAGNYASWSPLLFGTTLLALTFLSVCLALIFIVSTRGARKR